jgi:hypothetical protein
MADFYVYTKVRVLVRNADDAAAAELRVTNRLLNTGGPEFTIEQVDIQDSVERDAE